MATTGAAGASPKTATPPASPEELRKPVALDEVARHTAAQYLGALGRGRKATTAKDFAKADAEFSDCLKLVPGDPRALSMGDSPHLLDVEWLPDHLTMSACGARRQVPYTLASE